MSATSGNRPHIQVAPPEEFEKLYPERLTQHEIDEQGVLSLLVRGHGETYEAFRLTVTIEEMKRKLGEAIFKTILLDADLKRATKRMNSFMDADNNFSSTCLRLKVNERRVPLRDGFFIPPQPDDSDWFLQELASLDVNSHLSV